MKTSLFVTETKNGIELYKNDVGNCAERTVEITGEVLRHLSELSKEEQASKEIQAAVLDSVSLFAASFDFSGVDFVSATWPEIFSVKAEAAAASEDTTIYDAAAGLLAAEFVESSRISLTFIFESACGEKETVKLTEDDGEIKNHLEDAGILYKKVTMYISWPASFGEIRIFAAA